MAASSLGLMSDTPGQGGRAGSTAGGMPSGRGGAPGLSPAEHLARFVEAVINQRRTGSQGGGAGDEGSGWINALLNALGEGVCILKADGAVVWSNDLFISFGAGLAAKVGEACRQAAPELLKATEEIVPGAGVSPGSSRIIASDGREFELGLTRLPSVHGGLPEAMLAGVVRDVSRERLMLRRMDAIDRAGSELVRLDAEAVRRLNAHERLKFLEDKIVRYAKELLHFDHFAIRLLDEKTGRLELVMGYGLTPEYDLFDIYPRTTGCGISGYVAATGQTYVCRDVASDELFLPGVSGAKSSLTVPLRLHEKVIGIMNVESVQAAAFGEEERQLAEIFARYIAMALHMLDLLVVERSTTNQSVSGRVAGELDEPLRDILAVVGLLKDAAEGDRVASHALERIQGDVESIRQRVTACAQGPTTLLGVEKALAERTVDPVLAGKRVLVADDEARIRHIIGDVLRHRGCEVTICENGAVAIDELAKAEATRVPFHLVLSDIRMPDRNGYEVFAASRRVSAACPVILMTGFGYDPHHSIVRASQEGLQAVLFKPFEVEKLLDEARKALSVRGG